MFRAIKNYLVYKDDVIALQRCIVQLGLFLNISEKNNLLPVMLKTFLNKNVKNNLHKEYLSSVDFERLEFQFEYSNHISRIKADIGL